MIRIAEIITGVWQDLSPIVLRRDWLEPRGWWPLSEVDDLGPLLYGGGYLEPRDVYFGPTFQGIKPRTIHLGFDIFAPTGSHVFCPQDGEILALKDNDGPYDYGPTVIMRHQDHFTLYGHLSRESLGALRLGQSLKAGDPLGRLGHRLENGGWPAHIHVQIINDLPSGATDFPGVCAVDDIEHYRFQSPDPAPFLGLNGINL